MRDPGRIPEMCGLIERAWQRVPDQRLGQLIVNAIQPSAPCPEIFHAEESRLRAGLARIERAHEKASAEPAAAITAEVTWADVADPSPSTVRLERARTGMFEVAGTCGQILEARFGGEYRHGSLGNPDADAMVISLVVLMTRERPDVVVLDLSALRYTWGDRMCAVLDAVHGFDTDHPIGLVVIAGPESDAALRALGVSLARDGDAALLEAKALAARRATDIG